jgi:hypothetical protein
VGILSVAAALTAADFTGTWKLDPAKSRPGNALTSETMSIGPKAQRTTIDTVLKTGQKQHQQVTRIFDGKEHAATGVGFENESHAEICEQVDASTRTITQKRNGKVISVLRQSFPRMAG